MQAISGLISVARNLRGQGSFMLKYEKKVFLAAQTVIQHTTTGV